MSERIIEALQSKKGNVEVAVAGKWYEIDSCGCVPETNWETAVWLEDYDKVNLFTIEMIDDIRVLE
jgi:hypothetical protein